MGGSFGRGVALALLSSEKRDGRFHAETLDITPSRAYMCSPDLSSTPTARRCLPLGASVLLSSNIRVTGQLVRTLEDCDRSIASTKALTIPAAPPTGCSRTESDCTEPAVVPVHSLNMKATSAVGILSASTPARRKHKRLRKFRANGSLT